MRHDPALGAIARPVEVDIQSPQEHGKHFPGQIGFQEELPVVVELGPQSRCASPVSHGTGFPQMTNVECGNPPARQHSLNHISGMVQQLSSLAGGDKSSAADYGGIVIQEHTFPDEPVLARSVQVRLAHQILVQHLSCFHPAQGRHGRVQVAAVPQQMHLVSVLGKGLGHCPVHAVAEHRYRIRVW